MTNRENAIVFENLFRCFGKTDEVVAIDDLSASIKTGIITGLVGPDGAGKTTLIRMISGLLTPTQGKLSVNGLDPATQGDALRQQLGYMPQRFGLYEDLTVLENLTLYSDLRGVDPAKREDMFERMLEFTDLKRFTERRAGKLSGGMKQKLGLACTLLGDPEVLLLDEPSVGVDPISRRELWKMVGDLAGEGKTIIWSTAYLDEAERCPEVILLDHGKPLYCGSPDTLAKRMQGRSRLIRNISGNRRQVLKQALKSDKVEDGVIQGRAVRVVLKDKNDPLDLADAGAGDGATLDVVKPRLEDAVIDLLGGGPGGESVVAKLLRDADRRDEAAGEVVIEAKHLTKRFGDFAATDDISFEVKRGEIYGLLGPNGAGKSTTFKMLCGLLAPTSGEANVLGYSLKRSPGEARQRLGYMAQKFSLYGTLSVRQNMDFFSGIYGLDGPNRRERIDAMIDAFALKPYLAMSPDALPLGFKQRLALACAIMHDPAVLFLDEPTSGVDPLTRREFWTHINGVVEKGVTVMVTTHFMDEAEYCDRIGLVYRGKLIASGAPDDLRAEASTKDNDDPSMEEAFIELVERADRDDGGRRQAA
ncbi:MULTISPECIES: ATP-binding cassette domain-containing protein [unclassified Sphingomonas]|uniref:ATP-binding cassette domain-containing protein n=1 Tax=unclassified Sphingomonas TaxID=196159 RepID=UPI000700AE59|nr:MULTISPECIES: ATP-binding cassette domain-containing protein [unclassified Sphingomonas]KQX22763.1 multidrug ABC transporter ATP-binding protein [Sphingomonas sp. Root1294]KQY67759.1 multidrug ABC transporter ATP-binding protein [Sphingomonas sp. Root50]